MRRRKLILKQGRSSRPHLNRTQANHDVLCTCQIVFISFTVSMPRGKTYRIYTVVQLPSRSQFYTATPSVCWKQLRRPSPLILQQADHVIHIYLKKNTVRFHHQRSADTKAANEHQFIVMILKGSNVSTYGMTDATTSGGSRPVRYQERKEGTPSRHQHRPCTRTMSNPVDG